MELFYQKRYYFTIRVLFIYLIDLRFFGPFKNYRFLVLFFTFMELFYFWNFFAIFIFVIFLIVDTFLLFLYYFKFLLFFNCCTILHLWSFFIFYFLIIRYQSYLNMIQIGRNSFMQKCTFPHLWYFLEVQKIYQTCGYFFTFELLRFFCKVLIFLFFYNSTYMDFLVLLHLCQYQTFFKQVLKI